MAGKSRGDGAYEIASVSRVLDALEGVAQAGSLRVTDLAARLEVTKSSAFRYLWNLEKRGYVTALADGSYGPGPSLLRLGSWAAEPWNAFVDLTRKERLDLRDKLRETVILGAMHEGRVLFLEVLSSKHALRMVPEPGTGGYLHCTALGKAILSSLSDEEVTRILNAEGMPAQTGNTITNLGVFLEHLKGVRKRGWALDDQESLEGLRCVAVAIRGPNEPLGAISIEAPASRMAGDAVARHASELRETVEGIEKRLGSGD